MPSPFKTPLTGSASLSEHLHAITERLAAARTPQDVFGTVLTPALGALGAVAGAVLLVDETGGHLEIAAQQGDGEDARTLWQDGPLGGHVVAGDALKRREALFFGRAGDLTRAYPELEARTGGVAAVATAVLPMSLDERPLGAIILAFEEPHHFTPDEVRFLRTLAAQCALALGRAQLSQDLEARVAARTAELEAKRAALDAFVAYTEAVGGESDVAALARQAVQVVRANLAHVSAAYYELEDGRWKARAWSDDIPPEIVAQIRAGIPSDAPHYAQAGSGQPVFADGWDAAANGVMNAESYGAAAFLPLVIRGEPRGLFSVGTQQARAWTEREKGLVRAVARGLGVTLERTESARQLAENNAELVAHTRHIEEGARAQEAFVAFTEAVGTETDLPALARQATLVLRARFADASVGYYEPEGELWKARVWSEDVRADVLALMRAGVPADTPMFREVLQARQVVFTDAWDPARERLEPTEQYGTVANAPLVVGGEVRGVLSIGLKDTRQWSGPDQALFRAVARGLTLALERAEQARRLQAQNLELDARTRALEAFEEWSRDLTLDAEPGALIERAEELLLDLLPVQAALHYERDGERWYVRSMRGEYGSEGLRLAHEAGLPHDTTDNLRLPFQTGETYYQDAYNPATDGLADHMAHVSATAIVPLRTGRGTRGLIGLGRFGQSNWTETERTIIETVRRSLELALDRAEASRDLLTAQARLRAVVDNAPVVLFALDAHGTFTLSEGRGLAGLGLTPGQAVGRSASDLYAHVPDLLDDLRLALSGQEVHQTRPVGERVFESWTIPVTDVAGTVTEVVGVSTDVTERQRAEESLTRRNEELRRSNAELEQFAYIASHDLQAPIRAVTSFAGLIDKRYSAQLDERGRLYLRQIVESGEHMKRLVDDLLTFSRVHTEQRPLRFTHAGAVFDAVLRRLHPEIERTGASVTRGELPRVIADTQQLDQLLQNLISNGLKYRRERIPPEVHVSAQREGRVWRFAVRDNGIGIERQYFDRIFVIFQRLHGREEFEGTGIGLAVCKKIVERHGGQLWVESTPGQGSTFFFTLPAA
ncbi:GAF domain-containing protein [Deinococcus planocerae]|uniref:GAF domain-containing protein n=1 Tax=Deinococcus planocerae TaxID=1737569 RepID=UPI0015E145E0|nr:GAF domain-containing protein [Deinococcus planocerae]